MQQASDLKEKLAESLLSNFGREFFFAKIDDKKWLRKISSKIMEFSPLFRSNRIISSIYISY